MKLAIDRAALLKSIAAPCRLADQRSPIPILTHILIQATDDDDVRVTGTDLDIWASSVCRAEVVAEPGTACVPAQVMGEIVRRLPAGVRIDMALENDQLLLKAGRGRYKLPTLPPDDYPVPAASEATHRFAIQASALASLLGRTKFAISTEEARYYLNGVHLVAGERLRAEATDGHRLARVEGDLPEGAAGMPQIIVPRRAVAELGRMLGELGDDQAVNVEIHEKAITVAANGTSLRSRLIDATFPDCDRVIPLGRKDDCKITVRPTDLREVAQRVIACAPEEKLRGIRLTTAKDHIVVSTDSAKGSGVDEVDAECSVPDTTISFHAKYLIEAMEQIAGDDAVLMVADALSPVLITDLADSSALFVLMPMRF